MRQATTKRKTTGGQRPTPISVTVKLVCTGCQRRTEWAKSGWNKGRGGKGQRQVCVRCGGSLTVATTTVEWVVPVRVTCLAFRRGAGWSEWRAVSVIVAQRFTTHGMADGMMLFDCGDGWLFKVDPRLVKKTTPKRSNAVR